ncbi:hypothetical protein BH20BAC1_BH20BAC1_09150 [soil metagenome]
MKTIIKIMVLILSVIPYSSIIAQNLSPARPSLFANAPDIVKAPIFQMDAAFSKAKGTAIQLDLAPDFVFSGNIISSVKKYDKLSTIIVSSHGLNNTILCLSKIVNDDQTVSYVGHILSKDYADGYELKKSGDGSYAFKKINMDDLIQDR